MIVGGVLVGVAAIVVVLSSLGGSSGNGATSSVATSPPNTSGKAPLEAARSKHQAAASSPAASPAETHVVVLNGTETANLAHAISGDLRQSGYTQATPLSGRPPGANQVTVVEYASGHRADAEGVARSLSVTRVQPLESATAALGGSASVVVVVGADKASSVAGGGESSGSGATAAP